MIDKIKYWWFARQSNKEWKETNDRLEFIWGVKSYDDLTTGDANLWTMNDIDITFDKCKNTYNIGIETIYMFVKPDGDCSYIMKLLDKFTEWMISKGYSIEVKIPLYDAFTYKNINSDFVSIEELYGYFKLLVNGYLSQPK